MTAIMHSPSKPVLSGQASQANDPRRMDMDANRPEHPQPAGPAKSLAHVLPSGESCCDDACRYLDWLATRDRRSS